MIENITTNQICDGISKVKSEQDSCENPQKVLLFVNHGITLTWMVNKINETFQGMILNTYATCLLISTISLYGASSVFLPRIKLSNGLIWSFTSSQISLASMGFLRLYYLTNAGQNLSNMMKKAREELEYLNEKQKKYRCPGIKILKQKLDALSESPITPFSTFTLCNRTLLSTLATIFTYLIILIQFKLTEK